MSLSGLHWRGWVQAMSTATTGEDAFEQARRCEIDVSCAVGDVIDHVPDIGHRQGAGSCAHGVGPVGAQRCGSAGPVYRACDKFLQQGLNRVSWLDCGHAGLRLAR